jgi:UDP-galactopyranose mutase
MSVVLSDLICFSHLRWNFVFQRPQHLMTRFARERRVFFIEEPRFGATDARLDVTTAHGVTVAVPCLPDGLDASAVERLQRRLVNELVEQRRIRRPVLWFLTPLAWPIARDLAASAVVYDCMDELSGFEGAPSDLRARERELLAHVDVMFTGGYSLYEAKRELHPRVHAMPSSVDVAHFATARKGPRDPHDQRPIARPRVGFCGVIDERMNLELVARVADERPEWQFVMIGPVAKIDEGGLPRGTNLHYLGMKRYEELPAYFASWDAAILPFAHNAATRFISPTKTPEYLAAGCPVVSTSIRDVVRPYGEEGLVHIADTPDAFVEALDHAMSPAGRGMVERAATRLHNMSWDRTWAEMNALVRSVEEPRASAAASALISVPAPVAAGTATI